MKIAYFLFHPHGMFANGGGDVMLRNVYDEVKNRDIEVIKYDIWSREDNFDIFHLFASNNAVSELYYPLSARGKKLIVSAIDYSNMPKLKLLILKYIQKCYPLDNTYKHRQKLFDYASVVIANSNAEKKFLLDYFNIDEKKLKLYLLV